VDERLVAELETALADAGALLVRAQKYRRGAGRDGAALLRDALTLGDAARRLHRREALDASAATGLVADARGLVARIRAFVADVHADPIYRTAVAAHAAGDQPSLTRTLPEVFNSLAPVTAPHELFHAVPWRRRGRPRTVAELASDVGGLLAGGIPAARDDLSPGVDPALPAVVLQGEHPHDEPVVLRLAGSTLPAPLYRLEDTGEFLVYVSLLRAPVTVVLAPQLDADLLEDAAVDYPRYRDDLRTALTAAGILLA